jgi:hypothetical protein
MLEKQSTPNPPTTNPGWNGPYNRESGQKTLVLIGIIITLVTILSVLSLLLINKKSSVLAQTTYTNASQQIKPQITRH